MSRDRFGNTDSTETGRSVPDVLIDQRGGKGIPSKGIGVLRGRASVAGRIQRTGNSGMPPPRGFPPLPM